MKTKLFVFLLSLFLLTSCSVDPNREKDYKIKYVIFYTESHVDTIENIFHCDYYYPRLESYKGSNTIRFITPEVSTTAPIKILSIEEVK